MNPQDSDDDTKEPLLKKKLSGFQWRENQQIFWKLTKYEGKINMSK